MDASDIPAIPPSRLDHGEAWHEQWRIAHREMAIWNRVPSPHLIDRTTFDPTRTWLRHHYATLAGTTHLPAHERDDDGTTTWLRNLPHPATMRTITIRVVLGPDGRTIITAFDP